MDNFTPLDILEKTLKHWWFLAILTVFGGLVGGLIHFLHPPLYDAQVTLSTSLDFSQTGPLDEINIDYVLDMVGTLIGSSQVKNRVLANAQSQQMDIRPEDLRLYLERQHHVWVLQARYPDPQIAANMANLWGEGAYAELSDAVLHAQRARILEAHQTALENCLQGVAVSTNNQVPCVVQSFDQVQNDLESTGTAIKDELVNSRGISPALTFDLSEKAAVPEHTSGRGVNSLILAGALIGFLIGIASIYNDLPGRLAKVLRRG